MSVKAMGRVWDLKLSHNKRLVLLAMADHADHEGGNIYPSIALIAWKTGYSDRQVQRVIGELVADGILTLISPYTPQRPNVYRLNLDAGEMKRPFKDTPKGVKSRQNVTPKSRQNVTTRGDKMPARGVTKRHPRGDIAMSPEPPWEPSWEPPPPCVDDPAKSNAGGGGGFDPEVARLFASYNITQAEPLARFYWDAFPDVTLEELKALCNRFHEPSAGDYAGGRLYRKLRNGPPLARSPVLPPTPIVPPPPTLAPGLPASELRALREKIERKSA